MEKLKKIPDYQLIEDCLNGDSDSFEELVSRYKNLVYSLILRMTNNQDDVDDLAQEIFIKVYKNLGKYSKEYKFSTWIIRITTNHIIDFRRKKKCETFSINDVEYEVFSDVSPESTYIKKERTKTIFNVIENMPDIYKIPILLYHQQGFSYMEISYITGEPLSKVKNRIFRGRRILKESLLFIKEQDK